jgi:multidrug efflux pump subunit AcrA (membrane-fusion protein)
MPAANASLSHPRMRLAGVLLALFAPSLACTAAEAPLRLSDVQRSRAGITLVTLQADAVRDESASGGLRLGGRVVVPNDSVDLALAGVAGRLESVAVHVGQRVAAGGLLGQLFSTELLATQRAYLAARGQAELAAARLARDQELLAAGVIAASRLEATRAEATVASAALREQRQLLRLAGMSDADIGALRSAEAMSPRVSLRARRAGVVLEQLAEIGTAFEAGAPLFRVGALETLWVELQATSEQARRIAAGDEVVLVGCEARGVVLATGAQLAAATQTVALRAAFRAPGRCLLPNQFVEVTLRSKRVAADTVAAPQAAVVQREGRDYVFVATEAGFVPTPVTVVDAQAGHVRLGGVAPGERIASGGIAALKGAWLGLGPEAP